MKEYDARLTDRVRTRGALSADDAACFFLPIAESLAALHARGASHGAVSPRAIHVDSYGHATLIDAADVPADPAFVAPDPTWGLRPDPAANDVWAFAALVLYATTGEPPVADAALPRHAGWLRPIVYRALHKDPRQRASMSEVLTFLRSQLTDPDVRPERPTLPVHLRDLVDYVQPLPLPPEEPPDPALIPPRAPATSHVATPEPDPIATQVITELSTAGTAAAPAVVPTSPGKRRGQRPRGFWVLLACAAVILASAILGLLLLLLTGGDDTPDSRPVASSTTPVSDAQDTSDEPEATASARAVTANELEDFARNYVATASSNPESGFALLTRNYQEASPRYREVWSAIDSPKVLAASGKPDALSVSYTYSYRYNGSPRTEDVTLQLVQRGERLLIAGASAHRH